MFGHKQNVFDDFIAAAEWREAQPISRYPRLAWFVGNLVCQS
jgi:prolyl oligopeptidase PreP (S9A serine peptidase family)